MMSELKPWSDTLKHPTDVIKTLDGARVSAIRLRCYALASFLVQTSRYPLQLQLAGLNRLSHNP